MEEVIDVGGREGGRRSKEVTMLRIDHSDVYIENERLNEDLVHTIDSIHKIRYRKVMSRDSEIKQLKKSLQVLQKHTTSLDSSQKTPETAGQQRPRLTERHKTTQLNGINHVKDAGKIPTEKQNGSRAPRPSSTSTAMKSIQVRMPKAGFSCDRKHKDDSDNDNEDDSDDDDDDDISSDDSSASDNNIISDKGDENNNKRVNVGGGVCNMHKATHDSNNNKRMSTRQHAITRPQSKTRETATKKVKPGTKNKKAIINSLMSHLNLDKLPQSWYTDVVPASDVHIQRRKTAKEKHRGGKQNYRNDHVSNHRRSRSSKPRQHQTVQIRPATSGDIFENQRDPFFQQKHQNKQQQQQQQQQPQRYQRQRPFTSLGMRGRWGGVSGGGGGGGGGGWEDDIKRVKNGVDADRTATLLFCDQQFTSKTVRQLREEEELQASLRRSHSNVEILLEEAKEERKAIDNRVKLFVQSLDERKKSERLKNLIPSTSKRKFSNATSW